VEQYKNQDLLCWREPAAIYPTYPPLVEDEAQFKNTKVLERKKNMVTFPDGAQKQD
jgi:hypothetical protein